MEESVKTRWIVGAVALVMSLTSCETLIVGPRPQRGPDTLVLGRIRFVLNNDRDIGAVNRAYTHDVVVTVRNLNTGRVYVMRSSGRDGAFRLLDPDPGRYIVIRYAYRLQMPSGVWVDRVYVPDERVRFTVQRGRTVNIGAITWHEDRARMRDWEEW